MKFSLLVANYNNGHFFLDCFKSIVQQTYDNWEAIIVDDGSTDNSVSIIQNLIKGDSRFRLVENERNKGCGFTKNRCAELADGEVMGFLDPDDALYPEAIALMVKEHFKFKDCSLVTSRYDLVDLQMKKTEIGCHGGPIPPGKSFLTYGQGAMTHFATFKRSYYQRTSGIDPKMKRAVDQDLYYKLEEVGKHCFLDEVLYKYRIHDNSISKNDNLYKAHYWHYYAKKKAYTRRKKSRASVDNFSGSEIKKISSDYFLNRFERLKFTRKKGAKNYFLFKAIIADPFHKPVRKIKSLILLTLGKL